MGVNGLAAAHMTLRARFLDTWTTEWLESHKDEPVTVLHLAVGLDARAQRLSWGRNVRWMDVDLAEVVELRKRLLPEPEGDYRLIAGSVLDDSVLEQVPNDRPTIVIFEGLVPFLEPGDVDDLIRRLCERYGKAAPGDNQLLFDGCGWIMLALQRWTAVFKGAEYLKKIGTEWKSSVDDQKGMEKLAPGLRLVTDVVSTENSGIKEMPGKFQRISWVMARLPGFRYTTRYLRYVF
ncbi:S-adenosyl-L-methionine-dependent methyltransferase [Coniochaeta sp. PMI_546]|nr:S-adenosyl-L-methionine-dependent methyltransferase [Coniochaeta sp. PMI_546]